MRRSAFCGLAMSYTECHSCRISGKDDLLQVVDIGSQYLSGVFPKDISSPITKGPLQLKIGIESGLLQLAHSYDLNEMYGDSYGYRSGLNESMVNHLHEKRERLCKQFEMDSPKVAIDIGSNDGTLLNSYADDWTRVGVDPSSKKYKGFYKPEIHRYESFFDSRSAEEIKDKHGTADIVTSIAMFYDLEKPREFVKDIKGLLKKDGIWHFEQSYMPAMLRTNAYDTICHEHLEYYSLEVVANMLSSEGLKVVDVELNAINGGSFAITAARKESKWIPNSPIINWLLRQERAQQLKSPAPYRKFEDGIYRHREALRSLVKDLKEDGKRVCGYGASTKGNTLLQLCGLGTNEIDCIADVNPDKYGCYTPGTAIPIVSEEQCRELGPDYFLVLPWHFREGILKREHEFRKNGGKFIFPLPEIEII